MSCLDTVRRVSSPPVKWRVSVSTIEQASLDNHHQILYSILYIITVYDTAYQNMVPRYTPLVEYLCSPTNVSCIIPASVDQLVSQEEGTQTGY